MPSLAVRLNSEPTPELRELYQNETKSIYSGNSVKLNY